MGRRPPQRLPVAVAPNIVAVVVAGATAAGRRSELLLAIAEIGKVAEIENKNVVSEQLLKQMSFKNCI